MAELDLNDDVPEKLNLSNSSESDFTKNPFNKGVTYKDFLKNVKGKVTVDTLLKKANLTEDQVNWIKQELKEYKQNKKQ